MEIFEEYEQKFQKYIADNEILNKSYKISGNLLAHTLRKYILNIVNKKYQVSVVNSYIKDSKIEWDLLILKNSISKDEIDYNIYYPENVVCALEFKTSGAIFKKDGKLSIEYIEKYLNILDNINKTNSNSNIKYGYISLCELPTNLASMKDKYNDICFWFIEGYYRDRNNPKVKKNNTKDFEKFLKNLLD